MHAAVHVIVSTFVKGEVMAWDMMAVARYDTFKRMALYPLLSIFNNEVTHSIVIKNLEYFSTILTLSAGILVQLPNYGTQKFLIDLHWLGIVDVRSTVCCCLGKIRDLHKSKMAATRNRVKLRKITFAIIELEK